MVYWLNKVMGNALRFLYGQCLTSLDHDDDHDHHEVGHHGISSSSFGVSVLAQHLYNDEINSQVPEGLSKHVKSSKKAQSNWYKKLSKAWRESKPPPKTPEEASRLIIHILKRHQRSDVEGLLSFYGLPFPHSLVELPTSEALPLADGLKFELNTLPVDARAVPDGDGINVYISTSDTWESSHVPQEVQKVAVERNEALAERNYTKVGALHKQIIDANYRVIRIKNEDVLARKYRIRLRGIDAPENAMPYGKEAKDELVKIIDGQCLKILIFDEDPQGRLVGDVYCNGIFVQWEKYVRSRKIGLWASSDPETPWGWRRNHPEQRFKPCKNGSKNDCPDNPTIEAA